jgi:hypothetical protein
MSLTYTLRQLREEFQLRTGNATLELISKLEREHGFPRRLPCTSPPRWSAPAINNWFEHWDNRNRTVSGEAVPPEILTLRASLERKYA